MTRTAEKCELSVECEECARAGKDYKRWFMRAARPLKSALLRVPISALWISLAVTPAAMVYLGHFSGAEVFLIVFCTVFCLTTLFFLLDWDLSLVGRRLGVWFRVFKDASGQKHIHKRCDHDDSLDRHPDQPAGNSLLIPTPGMRGNPSAMIQLGASGGRVAAPIQMIGKATSLEVELRHVLVFGVAVADGYPPKFRLVVNTDDLISASDPSSYWHDDLLTRLGL